MKVYDEEISPSTDIFGERYTAAQVQWVLWGFFSALLNLPYTILGLPIGVNVCLTRALSGVIEAKDCIQAVADLIRAAGDKLSYNPGQKSDALAQSGNSNSFIKKIFTEDRPVSGISYIRNIGRKLRLVPEAKAASTFGYSRLTVIKDFWAMSRNIAYFLFTLVLIIVSFMIMFKVKISPQAVISIQSALPKIFLTLILITFSFAIAGFLLDLMYVVMGIFSLFFTFPVFAGDPKSVYNLIDGRGFGGFAIFGSMFIFLVLYLVAVMMALLAAILSLNLTGGLFAIILLFFSIILFIILIINFFLIIFALFKALAGFYVAVILGPLRLSLGALPQTQNAFSSWIKSMISKLAVFPATGILFYLSFLFLFKAIGVSLAFLGVGSIIADAFRFLSEKLGISFPSELFGINPDNLWGPPMLGNPETATSIAFILVALGIILMIPKVAKAIESAFAGRPFDYGSAISEPIKQGGQVVGSIVEGVGHEMQKIPDAGTVKALGKIIRTVVR